MPRVVFRRKITSHGPLRNPSAQRALYLLLEGYECAWDLRASAWSFATELSDLLAEGCSQVLLRWLMRKGYMKARLFEQSRSRGRDLSAISHDAFPSGTRFVATKTGAVVARRSLRLSSGKITGRGRCSFYRPAWINSRGELRFRDQPVAYLCYEESYQRTLVDTFHQRRWPKRLQDPLPQADESPVNVKQRLRNTVKNLNRHLKGSGLRFYVTGAGRFIGWKGVD